MSLSYLSLFLARPPPTYMSAPGATNVTASAPPPPSGQPGAPPQAFGGVSMSPGYWPGYGVPAQGYIRELGRPFALKFNSVINSKLFMQHVVI